LTQAQQGQSDVVRPLGEILVERKQVTPGQLEEALSLQGSRSQRLGELLCELGHLDPLTVRQALVEQAGIATVNLAEQSPDPEALTQISPELAFRHKVLPFGKSNGHLRLAMCDPFDRTAADSVRVLTGLKLERYYCPEAQLLEATRAAYGSNVARMIADLDTNAEHADGEVSEQQLTTRLAELASEPSVVNLVNLIIFEAIEGRASDIHIEPFEKVLKVKYRIDGILHEMSPPPKRLQQAILSRLKIMGGDEHRGTVYPAGRAYHGGGPAGEGGHPRGDGADDIRRVDGDAHSGSVGGADRSGASGAGESHS